jgi:hypothetical protein
MSIPKRSNVISHHIILNDLKFLGVTDTWLSYDHSKDDLLNVCPAVYNAVHTPRVGKRGAGLARIFRSSLRVEKSSSGYSASSFEPMAVRLHCNSAFCIHLVIIYRPPSQSSRCSDGQFLTDLADFLQLLMLSPGKMLMVGDFISKWTILVTLRRTSFYLSLIPLVFHSMSTVKLILMAIHSTWASPATWRMLSLVVSDLICDLFAVKSNVKVHRPGRPTKKVTIVVSTKSTLNDSSLICCPSGVLSGQNWCKTGVDHWCEV